MNYQSIIIYALYIPLKLIIKENYEQMFKGTNNGGKFGN